jgi:TonB family protein
MLLEQNKLFFNGPLLKPNKPFYNNKLMWTFLISALFHILLLILIPMLTSRFPHKKPMALQVWLKKQKKTHRPKNSSEQLTVVTLKPKKPIKPENAKYLAEENQKAKKDQQEKIAISSNLSMRPNIQGKASSDDNLHKKKLFKKIFRNRKNIDKRHFSSGNKFIKPTNENIKSSAPLDLDLKFSDNFSNEVKHFFDRLADVGEGKKTNINTWQWRHASFFNRVKTQVGQIWSPKKQISRYDPQGLLLGQRDRVTIISITIDKNGSLKKLDIINESGVAYLDEEAIRTFKQATPFLYPPTELFLEKDEFSFTFAFHLLMDRKFHFDFRWQDD